MNEFLRRILFLPEQSSTVAQGIDTLHYAVIGTTMFGATLVSLAVAFFLIRYRAGARRSHTPGPDTRSDRTRGKPPPVDRNAPYGTPVTVEIAVVVFLLALFLAFWIVGYRQFVSLRTIPRDAIDVHVVAKKWMWSFAYPSGAGSNAILYVPAGRPVKLVLTSRDVVHSFYVPQFRIKQDVVPGRVTVAWFEATEPGTYDIFCTEYCGTGHSTMRGQVKVLPQADYEQQLERLPAPESPFEDTSLSDLATRGDTEHTSMSVMGERAAAIHGCLRCHTADGAPHIGPTWARAFGSRITLQNGTTQIVDEAYITESIMDPMAKVHRGFRAVMPSYQGLLSVGEVGAIVEYMRSLSAVPRALRAAPLPPTSSSAIGLPKQAPGAPLEEQGPVQPLDDGRPVRPEGPPFAPPGTKERSEETRKDDAP